AMQVTNVAPAAGSADKKKGFWSRLLKLIKKASNISNKSNQSEQKEKKQRGLKMRWLAKKRRQRKATTILIIVFSSPTPTSLPPAILVIITQHHFSDAAFTAVKPTELPQEVTSVAADGGVSVNQKADSRKDSAKHIVSQEPALDTALNHKTLPNPSTTSAEEAAAVDEKPESDKELKPIDATSKAQKETRAPAVTATSASKTNAKVAASKLVDERTTAAANKWSQFALRASRAAAAEEDPTGREERVDPPACDEETPTEAGLEKSAEPNTPTVVAASFSTTHTNVAPPTLVVDERTSSAANKWSHFAVRAAAAERVHSGLEGNHVGSGGLPRLGRN
ncbi:hypothetical protein HK102_005990, partial [Quaeritorhiza haematococci]